MIEHISFATDGRLRINFWGEAISDLTGKPPVAVLGKKYHEVLPKIVINDEDALLTAVRKKKALTHDGYHFRCLYGQVKTFVEINPELTRLGVVKTVKVNITVNEFSCQHAEGPEKLPDFPPARHTARTFAHGVRNSLNILKGSVFFLKEKYSDASLIMEVTKLMDDEISHLQSAVSSFLSRSLVDSNFTETDVNALLQRIERITSTQMDMKKIKAVYRYGKIPEVRIDAYQLEQAVLNVINNAIEATPAGGKMEVRTRCSERSGKKSVLIQVADTGGGMENKKRSADKGKGRGFGLMITNEILKAYGGTLQIKSRYGLGTSVTLMLPVK